MGGNAIKTSNRMDRQIYDMVCSEISRLFNLNGIVFKISKTFKDKESFGDVDVVIDQKHVHRATEVLKPFETVKNGNVSSLGINLYNSIVQVDIIAVDASKLDQVHTYMNYGFFGMCIGITLIRHDLVYGIKGLETKEHRVLLSDDSDAILLFLGIDLSNILTARDLIKAISLSNMIDLNILVKCADKYDRLRPHLPLFEEFTCTKNICDLANIAIDYFGKRDIINEKRKIYNQDQFIRSKLNGNIVMDITGLERGEKLGEFIKYLKQTVFTFLDLFVKPQSEINQIIKNTYQSWIL